MIPLLILGGFALGFGAAAFWIALLLRNPYTWGPRL